MNQYIPYGGFKWIDPEIFSFDNVGADSVTGHILEIDLNYPLELHEKNNEYTYCCKHTIMENDKLSSNAKYCRKNGFVVGNINKLVFS